MTRYRKIEVRTWSDERFRNLSNIAPSGQGLWFFLLTGPHTSPIPGLFRAGRAAMAEELGWENEAFDKAFQEVSDEGMAKADFKARLVWLPNALKHNKPESPNVVRSWRVELNLLPECDLRNEAISHIRKTLESIGTSYVQAFDEICAKEPRKTTSKASGKALPKAMPNQEQEQEQEQEVPPNATPAASPPDTPAARPKGTRLAADWKLPKAWGDWATEETGFPADRVRKIAEKFRDFWHAKAGRDAAKLDWQATWRNWIREEADRAPIRPGGSASSPFAGAI